MITYIVAGLVYFCLTTILVVTFTYALINRRRINRLKLHSKKIIDK